MKPSLPAPRSFSCLCNRLLTLLVGALLLASCHWQSADPKQTTAGPPLLTRLPAAETGLTFTNELREDEQTNPLVYEYTYNGGGVAVGDLNGDGLDDIYFTANQSPNRLYLNLGHLKFRDITAAAGVGAVLGWKTGVTLADVNGDGRPDLYVCRSGARAPEERRNLLFINQGNDAQGVPHFAEQAAAYGLADPAYSTQAGFFDYDHDGDLDMVLLNHAPHRTEGLDSARIARMLATPDTLAGVKLYRNDAGAGGQRRFHDVTARAGLRSTRLTYGLSCGLADVNGDGYPDLYLGNDFLAPDYLYLNNGNGTFRDAAGQALGHTSEFTMGSDEADVNNDGRTDILTLDMLPADNRRQKLLLAADNYELFDLYAGLGLHPQYMRNMLHLNNGNSTFSEVGQAAGIANTDWSWSALLADLDNDGWKDLYVSNGYLHDYTNMDFIKYMGDFIGQRQGRMNRQDVMTLVQKMPSSALTDYVFRNRGGGAAAGSLFENVSQAWGLTQAANGSGAAYADLDNDGDLDLVVNNLNAEAFLYRNDATTLHPDRHTLAVRLEGAGLNRLGVGAYLTVYAGGQPQTQEQLLARGYQSSVSPVLHFGLGKALQADSVRVVWPGGRTQVRYGADLALKAGQPLVLREAAAGPPLKAPQAPAERPVFAQVPSPLPITTPENEVNDFKRQPLLTTSLSYAGPCLVPGDADGTGPADLFVGGAAGYPGRVFVGQAGGQFRELPQPALAADQGSEDTGAAWLDADGDGDQDLVVASGGYDSFLPDDPRLQTRLYLNDGRGHFTRSPASLPKMLTSASCVRAADVNHDGHPDLFVGGRVVPGRYPEPPRSYLLLNDGHGHFTDQTARLAPGLRQPGMVTDAAWADVTGDGRPDLITVGEWLPLQIWANENGRLVDRSAAYLPTAAGPGWWNTLLVADLNNDGRPDLVAGNAGLNTQCRASAQEPAHLIYKDFDDNGSPDPILTIYVQGQAYPFVTRDELLDQISSMRPRFPSYKKYAGATLDSIFTQEELAGATTLTATDLRTRCLLSGGAQGRYRWGTLPLEAQFTPVYALQVLDYDHDGHPDLLVGGNNAHSRLRFGNTDAGYGLLLRGDGRGHFRAVPPTQSGLRITGDVRSLLLLPDERTLLVGRSGAAVQAYRVAVSN